MTLAKGQSGGKIQQWGTSIILFSEYKFESRDIVTYGECLSTPIAEWFKVRFDCRRLRVRFLTASSQRGRKKVLVNCLTWFLNDIKCFAFDIPKNSINWRFYKPSMMTVAPWVHYMSLYLEVFFLRVVGRTKKENRKWKSLIVLSLLHHSLTNETCFGNN